MLLGRRKLERKASLLQSLIWQHPQKYNKPPLPGEGERLLQALFPYIIFTLMKVMMLAAAMTPTMLTIPLYFNPPLCIGSKPPIKRRRRSSNAVWCVSRSSLAPRFQGSAIFTMPTQQRRYHRLLVLQRTSPPRTWRGVKSQPSTPKYNLSTLVIWLKLNC